VQAVSAAATLPATRRVAVAGNPNTGTTSLFNRLTGLSARVGNYPGVTVEREEGRLTLPRAGTVEVLDVPGTYSLTARSQEEQIAIQAICGLSPMQPPDVVVLVVDATQLTRNLYLVLQVLETAVPTVVALNMVDMLEGKGLNIDAWKLSKALGVPVVGVSATRNKGIEGLKRVIDDVLEKPERGTPGPRWVPESEALKADIAAVTPHLPAEWQAVEPRRRDALGLWALLSLDEHDEIAGVPQALRDAVLERRGLAQAQGREIEAEVVQGRYTWIDERAPDFVTEQKPKAMSLTDKVDRVLLHPTAGFALFLVLMGLVFQSLFTGTEPAVAVIERGVAWLKDVAVGALPPGLVTEFLSEALIEGVGSVVVFLPQIMLLTLVIAVMEDSGYMARVAVLMDRLMKMVGLHGRAFVPMMSGFACAVPAVLATRTMERQRDRLLTMMVIPLMTCSARLPVYTLIIAALFPATRAFGVLPVQGLMLVGMYLVSTLLALIVAAVLGRTVFKGRHIPLLVEMPPYRMPNWRTVSATVWKKSKVFLTQAGTMILAVTAVMWVLLAFPRDEERAQRYAAQAARVTASVPQGAERDARLLELEHQREAEALRGSFAGGIGHVLEPVIRPLGFDWKVGIGLLGAFAAREVFVSTLGVVYGMGRDVDEGSVGLRERLRRETDRAGKPVYTPLMGLSLLVFFAIACQCTSTLAVVRRETKSWKWPAFLFGYTLTLAWVASFLVYQGGKLLGLG